MKKILSLTLSLLLLLGLSGCKNGGDTTTGTTIPSSGPITPTGPLFQRASYTVTDADAIAARDTQVLQVGNYTVTNGLFQFAYWSDYFSFLDSYGTYASTLGLDYAIPLDQQTLTNSSQTWQQHFISTTITSLHDSIAMMLEAEASQLPLPDEMLEELNNVETALDTLAKENGFDSAVAYIQSRHGPGTTVEYFRQFLRINYISSYYYSVTFDAIEISDQMVHDYYDQHQSELNESGISKDGTYFHSLRHILLPVKENPSDADWEQCHQDAKKLLNTWLAGEKTEDSFAALAKEHSKDSDTAENGGKYTGLSEYSGFDQAMKDWYLSDERQPGDYDIVKSVSGYHLVFYVEAQETWYYRCHQALLNTLSDQIALNAVAKHPITVDYSKIMLGVAPLSDFTEE